ncbi:hypothetical protein Q3G72_028805 [Acer saccharum]|nr:hypothetical protein Q3G72_028805 [Acer saccharum]
MEIFFLVLSKPFRPFDIAEDRILIFGTGPGMDGSDENSIVKWCGLINEIASKGKRMTYEELCNAVLANQHEWVRLVDRGPKGGGIGIRDDSTFKSCWVDRDDCQRLVRQCWVQSGVWGAMEQVLCSISKCKKELVQWNKRNQSNLREGIQNLQSELSIAFYNDPT